MTAFLALYMVSIVAFLLLDATWPGLVAGNFYRVQTNDLSLGGA